MSSCNRLVPGRPNRLFSVLEYRHRKGYTTSVWYIFSASTPLLETCGMAAGEPLHSNCSAVAALLPYGHKKKPHQVRRGPSLGRKRLLRRDEIIAISENLHKLQFQKLELFCDSVTFMLRNIPAAKARKQRYCCTQAAVSAGFAGRGMSRAAPARPMSFDDAFNDILEGQALNDDREDDDGVGHGEDDLAARESRQCQRQGHRDAATDAAPGEHRNGTRA